MASTPILIPTNFPAARGIFVTGTDTGVGKTLVSAILTRSWGAAYWKPVQSGSEEGLDSDTVRHLAELPPERIHPETMVLRAPVSPHEAARLEGKSISLADFALPRGSLPLVVEGAGGVLVPLSQTATMADLMAHFGLPVVLVARTALGTINHTLLSLAELRRRGLPVLGVVLSGPQEPVAREAITHMGKVNILAEIPFLEPPAPKACAALAEALDFGRLVAAHEREREAEVQKCLEVDARHIWHPFTQHGAAPEPLPIVRGHGNLLVDGQGRAYRDLISSWWVNVHGHSHPAIATAVAEQAATLEHVLFAGFTHLPATRVVERLLPLLPPGPSKIFFSDDGSTSVEVAIKMALQLWSNRGLPRRRLLAFEGAYHGDTFGAMAAGARSGFFDPFVGMGPLVDFVPYPETWDGDPQVELKEQRALAHLDALLAEHPEGHAALIVEPLIQGASGMRVCRDSFLREVAARCRQNGVLLICDEVMTGFYRTGHAFASLRARITPDLLCMSKGLSGGFLPLAITACTDEIYNSFKDKSFSKALAHGHSFTANPLGCAAAAASLAELARPETLDRIAAIAATHETRLPALVERIPGLHRARSVGTMAAFEVESTDAGYNASIGPRLRQAFQEARLLLRPLGNVVYLLPPYCTTARELEHAYEQMEKVLESILTGNKA